MGGNGFLLLNGRDATIIIGGATIYVLQRGPTIDSSAVVTSLFWRALGIIIRKPPLQPSIIVAQHPLHRFYCFYSLSSIAAYPLCNSGAWNVCSSDVGTGPWWWEG